jgi:hypothetical protein
LKTSLLEILMSSKNENVFICDFGDLTLSMNFDAW